MSYDAMTLFIDYRGITIAHFFGMYWKLWDCMNLLEHALKKSPKVAAACHIGMNATKANEI